MDQVNLMVTSTPPDSDEDMIELGKCDMILDLDILECPICTERFSSPVYQCENGHPLCSACHGKVSNCPFCGIQMGTIRCLVVEKLMDALLVQCAYARHGCNQMLTYNAIEDHIENSCEYRPCACPVRECATTRPKHALPQHLHANHGVQTFLLSQRSPDSGCRDWTAVLKMSARCRYAMVKCRDEFDVRLLVHREISSLGETYFCTSLGGAPVVHDLKVKFVPGDGRYCVALHGAAADDVRERENWRTDALVVSRGSGTAEVLVRVDVQDAVVRGLVRHSEA